MPRWARRCHGTDHFDEHHGSSTLSRPIIRVWNRGCDILHKAIGSRSKLTLTEMDAFCQYKEEEGRERIGEAMDDDPRTWRRCTRPDDQVRLDAEGRSHFVGHYGEPRPVPCSNSARWSRRRGVESDRGPTTSPRGRRPQKSRRTFIVQASASDCSADVHADRQTSPPPAPARWAGR